MKASIDYFKSINENYYLQPVAKLDEFILQCKSNSSQYVIISPLFTNILASELKFSKILSAASQTASHIDEFGYKKSLLVRKEKIKKISDLADKSLASINLGPQGFSIINNLLFKDTKLELEYIWVKKDLDAIFAVSFEQVDAALVSPLSINTIKNEKPEYLLNLISILESEEIYYPCLYTIKSINEMDSFKDTFKKMAENEKGKKLLNMLGINKWIENK